MKSLFPDMLVENWIVAVVFISVVAGVITSIAKQIRKYACHRGELELKRDLVSRGLSVEEIERVIAARSATTSTDSCD